MRKISIYAVLIRTAFDLMHKIDKECDIPEDCRDCIFADQEVDDRALCDMLSLINDLPEARKLR